MAAAKLNLCRVEFYPEAEARLPLTSLWADCQSAPGTLTATLQHDYPPEEFLPRAGWWVRVKSKPYRIVAVEGRRLVCEEIH